MKDIEIKFKFDKIKYVAEENESQETDSVADLVDSQQIRDVGTFTKQASMKMPMLNKMKSNDDAIGSALTKKSKKSVESGPKLDKHKSSKDSNTNSGSLPSMQ